MKEWLTGVKSKTRKGGQPLKPAAPVGGPADSQWGNAESHYYTGASGWSYPRGQGN